jgi:hypothetical protein
MLWIGNQGSIPDGGTDFSARHNIQTASGAHPVLYTGGSFPGIKLLEREANHSSFSTNVMKVWSCTYTPPYVLMTSC